MKVWKKLTQYFYSRRRLRELYESAMTISEQRRRKLESLQSLHGELAAAYDATSSELAVLSVRHSRLRQDRDRLRDALVSLSGCMPDRIYIYGDGERWATQEPEQSEYETIDFAELLGGGQENKACQ